MRYDARMNLRSRTIPSFGTRRGSSMKKTLMCATAAAAFASAGMVAQAEEGWYGRADATYAFDGRLDHDPVTQDVIGSMGGNSDVEEAWGGDLGLGYGLDNGFRIEGVLGYSSGERFFRRQRRLARCSLKSTR